MTARERAWITEIDQRGDLRQHDRILLLHAARGVALTNASARELLGVDSAHARAALHRLRDHGYLRQSGHVAVLPTFLPGNSDRRLAFNSRTTNYVRSFSLWRGKVV